MRYFLFALAFLAFLAGSAFEVDTESAIHEIEALILWLISAVLFSGACIVEAVVVLRREMITLSKRANKE